MIVRFHFLFVVVTPWLLHLVMFPSSSNGMVVVSSLRQRLLAGEKSYGPMIMSDSPILTELIAGIGYDHIIIDHEHSPTDIRSGQQLLQAIDAAQSTTQPIVRIPSGYDPSYMKKVLDSMNLPAGVLVPMVDSVEMALAIIQSTQYPPSIESITRGYSSSNQDSTRTYRSCAAPYIRSNNYGMATTDEGYQRRCDEDLLLMIQIGNVAGVERLYEIASLPRIDAIFIDPFDLSASIGKMGQFDDPDVINLIKDAESTVRAVSRNGNGCLLAGFKTPNRDLDTMFYEDGYSLICGTIDIGLIRDAALADYQVGQNVLQKNNKQQHHQNQPQLLHQQQPHEQQAQLQLSHQQPQSQRLKWRPPNIAFNNMPDYRSIRQQSNKPSTTRTSSMYQLPGQRKLESDQPQRNTKEENAITSDLYKRLKLELPPASTRITEFEKRMEEEQQKLITRNEADIYGHSYRDNDIKNIDSSYECNQQEQSTSLNSNNANIIHSKSILGCNLANLGDDINKHIVQGVRRFHMDVHDGVAFDSPIGLTYGPKMVQSIRKHLALVGSNIELDVFMSVGRPVRYVETIAEAGGSRFIFQYEALDNTDDAYTLVRSIIDSGLKCGISINPLTSIESIYPLLQTNMIDIVSILTVEPGFHRQQFPLGASEKIRSLLNWRASTSCSFDIMIDGGIDNKVLDKIQEQTAGNLFTEPFNVVIVEGSLLCQATEGSDDINNLLPFSRRPDQDNDSEMDDELLNNNKLEIGSLPMRVDGASTIVVPSMYSFDWLNMGNEIDRSINTGVRRFHLDIYDGIYFNTPSLTFGPQMVHSIRKHVDYKRNGENAPVELDVYLCVDRPARYVIPMARSGATRFIFPYEAVGLDDGYQLAHNIVDSGMKCGISINPSTPLEVLYPLLQTGLIDIVDVLLIEPTLKGQKFQLVVLEKIQTLLEWKRSALCRFDIMIDGGIQEQTLRQNFGLNSLLCDTNTRIVVINNSLLEQNSFNEDAVSNIPDGSNNSRQRLVYNQQVRSLSSNQFSNLLNKNNSPWSTDDNDVNKLKAKENLANNDFCKGKER